MPGEGWTYAYEPIMLPLPAEQDNSVNVSNAHGIEVFPNGNIVVTYQDGSDESKCLLKWERGAYHRPAKLIGPGAQLCKGVPHGLRAAQEDGGLYLYHANNQQSLHKTLSNGTVVWQDLGPPAGASVPFMPTWHDAQPGSPYVYLADGYGSSRIYVYTREGRYTGQFFGGAGTDHGKFSTCHAITWDWRSSEFVVSDRENHRLEWFAVNASDPSVFEYKRTLSAESIGIQRPCNVRVRSPDGVAIVPALEGNVAIVDRSNRVLSLVNVSGSDIGPSGWLHPHDAFLLPNDDFVLVTWLPGRIGYFRRMR